MGKLAVEKSVLSGMVGLAVALSVADWAQAALATISTKSPIFFMLPPRRDTRRLLSSKMPRKLGFKRKVTRGVRGAKDTTVSGGWGKLVFHGIRESLLHLELSPCKIRAEHFT